MNQRNGRGIFTEWGDTVARMRTIDAAFDELKRQDPETVVTRSGFRRLVVSGQIKSARVGCKYLVDLSAVEDFFLAGHAE